MTVAVIEAGAFYEMDNGNISQVPGYGSTYLSFNDLAPSTVLVDWDLITKKQEVSDENMKRWLMLTITRA